MKLSANEPAPRATRRPLLRLGKRSLFVLAVFAYLLLVYVAGLGSYARMSGLFRNFGYYSNRDPGGGLTHLVRQQVRSALRNLEDADRSRELPVLRLDVEHKHYMKLAEKRAAALDYGALISSDDDFVPASIRFEGRTIPVKIRLKGDELVHLQGEDWSLRVKVKGGEEILGRRVFSLQHPRVRGYHWDALFLDQVRRMGVLAIRHEYVQLFVNGDNRGVMDLEEHFSKELLEAEGRREGVMLALEDTLLWNWRQAGGGWMQMPDYYPLARSFRPTKVGESPVMLEMDEVAKGLLRGFFDGTLRPSEVFDPVTWGRLLAAVEVWDFTHLLRDHNLRFYFNPVNGHIEPIAYDSTLTIVPPSRYLLRSVEHYVTRRLLEDDVIRREFIDALEELRQEVRTPEYKELVRREDQRYRSELCGDYPLVTPFPVESLEERAKELERVTMDDYADLFQTDAPFPEPLLAFVTEQGGESYLELVDQAPGRIDLEGLLTVEGHGPPEEAPGAFAQLPHSLPGFARPGLRTPVKIPLDPSTFDPASESLVLTGRDAGNGKEFQVQVEPYVADGRPVLVPLSPAQLQQRLPFAGIDEEAKELVVPPGDWPVAGQTVLPAGLGLRLSAGATLRFAPDSNLIVQGPCNLGERAGAPVRLIADPGVDVPGWQGIAVLRAGAPCLWYNVAVEGTTGVHLRGLPLTGAVTLYQSEVYLQNCRFDGTTAEDALNLVECTFSLTDVSFADTRSDALDSDFSKGSIHGGEIEDIGGDGVDFSGSTVDITGTDFRRIRDKAISVGERSNLTVGDVTVLDCGTGAASKDGSTLTLQDARLDDIRYVAVMAYVKKPEFGPGRAECRGVTVSGSRRDYLAQLGSRIFVDGVEQAAEQVDIDALYKTYMKK